MFLNFKAFYTVFYWRILFFSKQTFSVLKNYRNIFLLLTLLLGPMFFLILSSLSTFVVRLIDPISVLDSFLIWSGFLVIYLVSVLAQKKSILGGVEYYFLVKNNLGKYSHYFLNIFIILISNTVLLIPFLISLFSIFYHNNHLNIFLSFLTILSYILLLLNIQLTIVTANRIIFLSLCLFTYISIFLIPILGKLYISLLINIILLIFSFYKLSNNIQILNEKSNTRYYNINCIKISRNSSLNFNLNKIILQYILLKEIFFQKIILIIISILPLVIYFIKGYFYWENIKIINLISLSIISFIAVSLGKIGYLFNYKYRSSLCFLIKNGLDYRIYYLSFFSNLLFFSTILSIPAISTINMTLSLVSFFKILLILYLGVFLSFLVSKKIEDHHIIFKFFIWIFMIISFYYSIFSHF
ncbi:hypothetical protein SAMN05421733_102248 [Acinetobacter boissieri]|uniref:Uncharacterized protein n=1 Tax=Acinetobacter boissieri TaxID=1219383 RepID=A0A1G6GV93_9GAMM|nr:hypothetical protein SAMN05421733_102248 [Acinetobacter boissieri]